MGKLLIIIRVGSRVQGYCARWVFRHTSVWALRLPTYEFLEVLFAWSLLRGRVMSADVPLPGGCG